MTVQEAIDIIQSIPLNIWDVMSKSEDEAIDMAFGALEKQAGIERALERLETNIDTAHEDRFMTYPKSSGRNFAYGVEIGLKRAVEIIKEEVG